MIIHRTLLSVLVLLISVSFAHAQNLTIPDEISASEESIVDATPVRMAYFSYVDGEVLWRIAPDSLDTELSSDSESTPWDKATVNLPLRVGMEVRVEQNGRAELCFDDGSLIRLGGDSHLVLETLEAEADSEFTALRLSGGLATLKLKHENSLFQLQSGSISVRARGPAAVRVDASTQGDAPTQIAVRAGRAFIENEIGTLTLRAGQSLQTSPDDTEFSIKALPAADSWERWNLERDDFWAGDDNSKNLPENLSLVAGNLNRYGTWRDDTQHGRVWYPRATVSTWRPYSYGRWSWVFPYGWTWVSDEPWGWAPYHYGTWISTGWGWGWVPGPAMQPWSPGVVSFFWRDGNMCWAPLSPWDVRYPTLLPISRRNPRWSRCFSIGSTAVYYPTAYNYCEPRPWNSSYINYVTNVNYITYVTKVRKEKKIVCKPPRRGRSTHVRLDGAPDEQFEKIFGFPPQDKKSDSRIADRPSTFVPRNARLDMSTPATARDGATPITGRNVQRWPQQWQEKWKESTVRTQADSNSSWRQKEKEDSNSPRLDRGQRVPRPQTVIQPPAAAHVPATSSPVTVEVPEPSKNSREKDHDKKDHNHDDRVRASHNRDEERKEAQRRAVQEQAAKIEASREKLLREQARESQERENRERETRQRELQQLEQQNRERQDRARQAREQQLREQQIREQQIREQQVRAQQINEQRMREQRLQERRVQEERVKEQKRQEKNRTFSGAPGVSVSGSNGPSAPQAGTSRSRSSSRSSGKQRDKD